MKNTKRNTLIVLAITVIVLFFVMKDDYQNIINNLILANKWLILLGIIFMSLYVLLRSLCLYLVAREYSKKVTLKRMVHQTLITQFFNGITPFSTGGQPMQVYMLKKTGVTVASATNVIVQDFIMYQLALIIIGIFALFVNMKFHFFNVSSTLSTLIVIGFVLNLLVGVGLLFVSFSKKFNDFIGKLIIKLAAKFKIVKDQDETVKKWEEKLSEFHNSAKLFKKKKMLFVKCFCYQLLALVVYYVIPMFILMSIDSSVSISIMEAITASAFVLLIGNFVPIPGGSGGIEWGFLQFFNEFISPSGLSSALIIWRFITYYLGMIVGGIALGFFKGDEEKA